MNNSSGQSNNTSLNQSGTVAYPEVKITSMPPLPIDKTKFKNYDEDYDDDYDDRPRRRGRGCAPGCGCRSIACGGLIVIALLIAGIIFIAVNKPSGIWQGVVSFLNAGVSVPNYEQKTASDAKNEINDQITKVGDNIVTMDEDSFTAILREKVPEIKNPVVDIEPDIIHIYWELDNTIENEPLYGVLEIEVQDKKLIITKVGTSRVGSPAFLNDFVSNTVISLFNSSNSRKDGDYSLLYNFLAPDKNITITDLRLDKDKAVMTINISANLF